MKTISKITLLLFIVTVSCKAQNIINITDFRGHGESGDYIKDIDNMLNPFVGTYIYTSGSNMIKIELRKKENATVGSVYTEDTIIGEYQVIENGVEKINKIPNFLNDYSFGTAYSINGNHIVTKGNGCYECVPGENALRLGILELSTKNSGFIIIRKLIINGQEAIKVRLVWTFATTVTGYLPPSFPSDEYTLIQQ